MRPEPRPLLRVGGVRAHGHPFAAHLHGDELGVVVLEPVRVDLAVVPARRQVLAVLAVDVQPRGDLEAGLPRNDPDAHRARGGLDRPRVATGV